MYSNTTLVKVKSQNWAELIKTGFIQIQHLLKLNGDMAEEHYKGREPFKYNTC